MARKTTLRSGMVVVHDAGPLITNQPDPAYLSIASIVPPGTTVVPIPPAGAVKPFDEGKVSQPPQYVTLAQICNLAKVSKRTAERWKSRKRDPFPSAEKEGGGGKAALWIWGDVRAWVIKETGMDRLPIQFPFI